MPDNTTPTQMPQSFSLLTELIKIAPSQFLVVLVGYLIMVQGPAQSKAYDANLLQQRRDHIAAVEVMDERNAKELEELHEKCYGLSAESVRIMTENRKLLETILIRMDKR